MGKCALNVEISRCIAVRVSRDSWCPRVAIWARPAFGTIRMQARVHSAIPLEHIGTYGVVSTPSLSLSHSIPHILLNNHRGHIRLDYTAQLTASLGFLLPLFSHIVSNALLTTASSRPVASVSLFNSVLLSSPLSLRPVASLKLVWLTCLFALVSVMRRSQTPPPQSTSGLSQSSSLSRSYSELRRTHSTSKKLAQTFRRTISALSPFRRRSATRVGMRRGIVHERRQLFENMTDHTPYVRQRHAPVVSTTAVPPLDTFPSQMSARPSLQKISYQVHISTSTLRTADTNEHVYIQIVGDRGATEFISLHHDSRQLQASSMHVDPNAFNPDSEVLEFPVGSVREFVFKQVDVGNVVKIILRHDPKIDHNATWRPDRIYVLNRALMRGWSFICCSWLSRDRGNQMELQPVGNITIGERAAVKAKEKLVSTRFPPRSSDDETSSSAAGEASEHVAEDEIRTTRIRFQLQKFTQTSSTVYVTGSTPLLGEWDPAKALRMTMHSGTDGSWRGEWRLEVELDDEYDSIAYTYIVVTDVGNGNLRLKAPDQHRVLRLKDNSTDNSSSPNGTIYVKDLFGTNKFGLPSASPHAVSIRPSPSKRSPPVLQTPTGEAKLVGGSLGSFHKPITWSASKARSWQSQNPVQRNLTVELEAATRMDLEPDVTNGPLNMSEVPEEQSPQGEEKEAQDSSADGTSLDNGEQETHLHAENGSDAPAPTDDVSVELRPQLIIPENLAPRSSIENQNGEIGFLKERNSATGSGDEGAERASEETSVNESAILSPKSSQDDVVDAAEVSPDVQNSAKVPSVETQAGLEAIREERDALANEVEELRRKNAEHEETADRVGEISDELTVLRSEMEKRNEQFEAHHADLVRFIMDRRKTYQATLDQLTAEVEQYRSQYEKEFKERRRLFNTVQELRGNIRVFCRVRPLKTALPDGTTIEHIAFPDSSFGEHSQVTVGSKNFEFDHVFAPDTTQTQVYEATSGVVASVLEGYNVCVFAYGQTGSGKTYTMDGPVHDRGVNYRALSDLFQLAETRSEFAKIGFSVSMMEIYNETLRDLVGDPDVRLEIRRQSASGATVHVPNLTEVGVDGLEAVLQVLNDGMENRSKGRTDMNEHSSRSHLILKVTVTCEEISSGVKSSGMLHLVDLAGSERVARSQASGARLTEAKHINKSLATLGDVFSALTSNASHIPYRNSKLTYLLQDSLGGDSKTLMFVNISSDEADTTESVSSLHFAQRVAKVVLGSAQKHIERTAETRAVAALESKVSELHVTQSKVSTLQKDLKRREDNLVESSRKCRVLEGQLSALQKKLEEGNKSRQGELREQRSIRDKSQNELRVAQQKMKSANEEIRKLKETLVSKDRVISAREKSINELSKRMADTSSHARGSRPASTPSVGSVRKTLPRAATMISRNNSSADGAMATLSSAREGPARVIPRTSSNRVPRVATRIGRTVPRVSSLTSDAGTSSSGASSSSGSLPIRRAPSRTLKPAKRVQPGSSRGNQERQL